MSMKKLAKQLHSVLSSLLFVIVVSVALGIYVGVSYPALDETYPHISLYALAGIFFLSSLKIELRQVVQALSDKTMLFVVVLCMLILFPFLIYYATNALYPTLAVSFLLLASMPSGMTAPFLTELAGGKQSLALVLTVITSLLAPITVPFVMYVAAGHTVSVDVIGMFTLLAQAIFIPFFLAQLIKRYASGIIRKTSWVFKPVSTVLLGVLIMFVIAKRPGEVIDLFQGGESLVYMLGLIVLFTVLHILGYLTVFWRHKKERVTTAVCLTYMNFTLAIVLADTFFATESYIVVPTVLSVLPWALFFIPFRSFVKRKRSLSS
jgi:BASS family bile acid:Na+ symporter